MAKNKSKQKNYYYFIFGIVVLIASLYFFNGFLANQMKKVNVSSSQEEKMILSNLSKDLKTDAVPRDYNYDDWVLKNDGRAPLKGQQIILGTNGTNGVGKYGDFTSDDLSRVDNKFLTSLQGKISNYFESQGFKQNSKNTDTKAGEIYFSTLAFQKGNEMCLSHVAKNSDPFDYITCGEIDRNQLQLQDELLDVFEEQKSKNPDDKKLSFRVEKVDGDFATGAVYNMGGYQWIAKKKDNKWTTIWSGQDFPLCSEMEKFEVTSSMYPGCYNPENEKVQKSYQNSTELK